MSFKRIFSILLLGIFITVLVFFVKSILMTSYLWTTKEAFITFLTSFFAAFSATFFVLIADRLKDRKKRLTTHYNAVVRFQHLLNRIQSKIDDNIQSFDALIKALKKNSILTFTVFDIPTAFDLVLDLLNDDFINDLCSFNREIETINTDFKTVERKYEELKWLAFTEKIELNQFLSTNENTINNFQTIINHLKKLKEDSIKLLAVSRILGREHKSYTFVFGFDIKKKYPKDIGEKIKNEINIIKKELKNSEEKWISRFKETE